jgi:hypothetical protein
MRKEEIDSQNSNENAAQDDGIKRVCDIELHLVVPVVEEYIESNIFQIFDESVALETFNPDLHEDYSHSYM